MVHILYGTLISSSLSFIGPRDSVAVLGRFMALVLVCQGLLVWEIAGLCEAHKESRKKEGLPTDVITAVQSAKDAASGFMVVEVDSVLGKF